MTNWGAKTNDIKQQPNNVRTIGSYPKFKSPTPIQIGVTGFELDHKPW
jgi:hypothetical protein